MTIIKTPINLNKGLPTGYAPFRSFNSLLCDLNNQLGFGSENEASNTDFFPPANIVEREKDYLIELELPAVTKKDISVAFKNNELIIKGERKNDHKQVEGYFSRLESSYGSFERRLFFEDVTSANIAAQHENGVLRITLPKRPESIKRDVANVTIK